MTAGLSPFGALSPADIARLMRQAQPMAPEADEVPDAVPPGFSGFVPPSAPTMQPQAIVPPAARVVPSVDASAPQAPEPMAPSPASLPSLVGQAAPALQQAPIPAPAPAPSASVAVPSGDEANKPASNAVPAQARAPLSIAPLPTSAAPTASAEPSFGDHFISGLKQNGDLLIGLGTGLMSTPGWGRGMATGLQYAQKSEKDRVATDLARAEFGLKQRKLAQETGALAGNAAIIKRAFPNLSDAEATAAGSNAAQVTEALKILRDPNHGTGAPAGYRVAASGGFEAIPGGEADPATIRTKAQAQAEGANAGKPDETFTMVSEPERISLGLPPGSYQRDSRNKIGPVNPTGTTINMGGEKAYDAEVGKAYAKKFSEVQTAGTNATNKLNSLALIEQQMTSPSFYSGYGGEQVKRFNQLLGAIGIKDARTASPAEVVDALSNQVVLDQLGGSLGAGISDSDRKSIALIGPGIAKTPEGNRQLIGIYRSIAQREQQVAQMARDYAKANGGRIDAGFDDQVAKFAIDNPLFPQAQSNATASAPQEPPQGAPPGTRMAPDGRFYAADPARPGKFLMVR